MYFIQCIRYIMHAITFSSITFFFFLLFIVVLCTESNNQNCHSLSCTSHSMGHNEKSWKNTAINCKSHSHVMGHFLSPITGEKPGPPPETAAAPSQTERPAGVKATSAPAPRALLGKPRPSAALQLNLDSDSESGGVSAGADASDDDDFDFYD